MMLAEPWQETSEALPTLRVGLLYPARDPRSPENWSGTPNGLASGLEQCGAEVVPIGARLPRGLHEAVAVLSRIGGRRGAVADRTPVRQASRTWVLSRGVANALPLDGVVAMGTEMYDLSTVLRPKVPCATYDDGTLIQMWDNPDSDIRKADFPQDQVRLWFARQEASSRAASVCCVSTTWASRSFIQDYGVPPERVHVVGMGHRPRDRGAQAGRDWSLPKFLFIGVDWQRKNGDAVLRAFIEVQKSFPRATLDVVGRHPCIDLPGVRGHGYLPRDNAHAQKILDGLLGSATAFVLPSRFDPSPIAYLEAASAGLPVIATTQGGAAELLREGAITVHPDDFSALVGAMQHLSNPMVAQSMGALASNRAAASTWDDVASRLLVAMKLRRTAGFHDLERGRRHDPKV